MSQRPRSSLAIVVALVAASMAALAAPSPAHAETPGVIDVVDYDCCDSSHGGVFRVDPSQPSGSNQTLISSGQHFVNPIGIALATDGKLYVADHACCATGGGIGAIIRIDPGQPASSNQTLISSGQHFLDPMAIALAADGKLYVADGRCCGSEKGGVIRVDPGLPNGGTRPSRRVDSTSWSRRASR